MKLHHLLILLLVLAISCKPKEKKETLKVSVIPQDTVKVEETPAPPPPEKKVDLGVNLDDKYFLVASTNTVKAFADAWNKKYQEDGFKSAVIMRNDDGYYRVAVESFNDLDLAKTALDELKKKKGFKNVMIMVINK